MEQQVMEPKENSLTKQSKENWESSALYSCEVSNFMTSIAENRKKKKIHQTKYRGAPTAHKNLITSSLPKQL